MTTPEEDYPVLAEIAATVDENGVGEWGDADLYTTGPEAKRALAELAELRRWKSEASRRLALFEAAFDELDREHGRQES